MLTPGGRALPNHQKITEKVDVYALAMVYYSLLARHSPYKNVKDGTGMIKNGIPPPTDPSWHAGFLEVGLQDGRPKQTLLPV